MLKIIISWIVVLFILSNCSVLSLINPKEDVKGPVITIVFPTNHTLIETNSIPVSLLVQGTASDVSSVQSVKVSVNGGGFVKAEGQEKWQYRIQMKQYGDYQIDVFGIDQPGNIGITSTIIVSLKEISNL